jgi:hypothetical protein
MRQGSAGRRDSPSPESPTAQSKPCGDPISFVTASESKNIITPFFVLFAKQKFAYYSIQVALLTFENKTSKNNKMLDARRK